MFGRVHDGDHGRNPQHQKDIGRVGPHHVAHGDAGHTVQRRLDRDQQLRRGCAEGHDGQADDQRRNSDPESKVDRPLDQRITCKQQDYQPEGCHQPDHDLSFVVTAGTGAAPDAVSFARRATRGLQPFLPREFVFAEHGQDAHADQKKKDGLEDHLTDRNGRKRPAPRSRPARPAPVSRRTAGTGCGGGHSGQGAACRRKVP